MMFRSRYGPRLTEAQLRGQARELLIISVAMALFATWLAACIYTVLMRATGLD